ncbi:MAG: TolC family protein, partial [Sedimentisphaerales bacterium]
MVQHLVYIMLAGLVLSGCASYHSMPLPSSAGGSKPVSLNDTDIKIQAEEIHHPVIEPIDFNYLDGLSPDEAAILAVIANPKLKAAREKKRVASGQLLQAGLLPNPRLSYDMEFPTGGDTAGTVTAFGVRLDWAVRSLISRGARMDAARHDAKSVSLEIAWQEWQVAEAAKLYLYRLMVADKQLAIAEDALAGQRESHKLIKKGFNLGEKTSIQLSDADSAVRKSELAMLAARQTRETERLALNQTLGLSPEQTVNLQKGLAIPGFDDLPSAQKLINGMESRRLDLLALRAGYQSQEAKVRAAVKSQFPRISIGPSVGRDTENVDTAGFGVNIELPFFSRNQGNIAIERATRQQVFDEYIARLSDARFEIAKMFAEVESTRRQIDAVERSLPVLRKLAQSYKQAAKNGTADYLSYYGTLNEFHSRQIELFTLQGKLVDLGVALEIASGRYLPSRTASEVKV